MFRVAFFKLFTILFVIIPVGFRSELCNIYSKTISQHDAAAPVLHSFQGVLQFKSLTLFPSYMKLNFMAESFNSRVI